MLYGKPFGGWRVCQRPTVCQSMFSMPRSSETCNWDLRRLVGSLFRRPSRRRGWYLVGTPPKRTSALGAELDKHAVFPVSWPTSPRCRPCRTNAGQPTWLLFSESSDTPTFRIAGIVAEFLPKFTLFSVHSC